jgi:hypothetical protein
MIKEFLVLFIRVTGVVRSFRALKYAGQAEFLRLYFSAINHFVKLLFL